MPRSKYLSVRVNFVNYALVVENGDYIDDDWMDANGGEEIRCICPICNEYLTEHQYKNEKLVQYESEHPEKTLAHKKCLEKFKTL